MNARPSFVWRGVCRITASYPSLHEANAGAAELLKRVAIDERRVHVVGLLQRRRLDQTLMPVDDDALWRDFITAHLQGGAVGLVCGAWLWAICQVTGVAAVASNPATSAMAFVLLGLLLGFLCAGVLIMASFRHRSIDAIEATVVRGRWVLTVRTECTDETRRVLDVLNATGARVATAPASAVHHAG